MYTLQKVQNQAANFYIYIFYFIFALKKKKKIRKSRHDHISRHFTGCQSKTGLFLRYPLFSSFCFVLMVPCHHTCHRVSLYTLLLAHSVPVQMKKNYFLCKDGNLRALVTGRSLFRLPLSGTTFLLTSDYTAVLSHSSKLLSKPASLYFWLL